MPVKTIVFIVLAILIVIFTLQNTEVITIRFLLWTKPIHTALILLCTLFVGIILGWLITWMGYSQKKRKEKREAEEIPPTI